VLAVAPNFPAKTLQEIIDLAKKQPGKLTYGSTGHGGTQHLAGEMLKLRAGIDIVHVPYKGAAGVMNDLIAGHIAMAFMTSVSSLPHLQERQVIPVAVAAAKRLPQIPEMPTMGEAGLPGFESDSWNGLFAPAGTPPAIVAKLQAAVAKAVQTQDMRDKLLPQGAVLVGSTPAEFRDIINREVEHWANIFKTIQVKPE
jgi:tripartite-type tricarboxylate transporter receptor subunit TctC